VQQLWTQIEEIVIKTLICAEDPIVNSTTCYLPNLYNGYELFGFDIILDSDLKPWLLEVNISPSLHSSSPLDLAVKGPMIKELFNIVGYHLPPKLSSVVKVCYY
jgi:tubulin polyglutamylase TTLL4